MTQENCSICLESIIDKIKILNCKHIFHKKCINKWLQSLSLKTCPICRDILINKETFNYAIANGDLPLVNRCLVIKQFNISNIQMEHLAINGYYNILAVFFKMNIRPTRLVVEYLTIHGQSEIIKYLCMDKRTKLDKNIMYLAIKNGHINIVRLCIELGINLDLEALNNATYYNQPMIIQMCLKDNIKPNKITMNNVITSGNIYYTEKFMSLGLKPNRNHLNLAIEHGHFNIVKLLHYKIKFTKDSMSLAVKYDQIDIIKFIISTGSVELDTYNLKTAILYEYTEIVKLALSYKLKVNHDDLHLALSNNNNDICLILLDNGVIPSERTINLAVRRGYIEIMKMFILCGCKLTMNTLNDAVLVGNQSMVQLILDNNFDLHLNNESLDIAVHGNYIHLVQMCIDNNVMIDQEAMLIAIRYRFITIVELFMDYGFKVNNEIMNNAIEYKCIRAIEIAIKQGIRPIQEVMYHAIRVGNVDIIKLLHEKCDLKLDQQCVRLACLYNNTKIVLLCINHGKIKLNREILDFSLHSFNYEIMTKCFEYGIKANPRFIKYAVENCDDSQFISLIKANMNN